MFQTAATFGAGVFAGHGLSACAAHLPECTLRGQEDDEDRSFKLLVHVHGGVVPEIGVPGLLSKPRPQLEVVLGKVQKETEVADFVQGSAEPSLASLKDEDACRRWAPRKGNEAPDVPQCNWQFGDTLTFSVRTKDVQGGGLRLRLGSRTDLCLGPIQVNLPNSHDLGEGMLDLREKVLPECRRQPSSSSSVLDQATKGSQTNLAKGSAQPGQSWWQTQPQVVSLTRVWSDRPLATVSRVVLSVSINADPDEILREVARAEMPLVKKVVDPFVQCCEMQPWRRGCTDSQCESLRPYRNLWNDEPESEAPPMSDYSTCEVPPSWSTPRAGLVQANALVRPWQLDEQRCQGLSGMKQSRRCSEQEPVDESETLLTTGLRGLPSRAARELASPQVAKSRPQEPARGYPTISFA